MNSSRKLRISGPSRAGGNGKIRAFLPGSVTHLWPALRRHVRWDWMIYAAMSLGSLGAGTSLLDSAGIVAASYAQELRAVMVLSHQSPSAPNPDVDYETQH